MYSVFVRVALWIILLLLLLLLPKFRLYVSVSVCVGIHTPVHMCCVCVFSLNFNSFWPFDAVASAATAVFVIRLIQWFRFLTNTHKNTITCTSFDSAVCLCLCLCAFNFNIHKKLCFFLSLVFGFVLVVYFSPKQFTRMYSMRCEQRAESRGKQDTKWF